MRRANTASAAGNAVRVHSVMADGTGPCEVVVRAAHPRPRPYVIGYSGFRAGPDSGRITGQNLLATGGPVV